MNLHARVAVTASVASMVALGLPLAPTATADSTLIFFEHDTVQNFVAGVGFEDVGDFD